MHQFDAETALQKGSEGYWQGQLSGQWNIGANPNGGYMVALALQANFRGCAASSSSDSDHAFSAPGIGG